MATTDTWESPALDQSIIADLPAIQRKFQALVKGDPSLVQNLPVGAKRLVEISSGNWQVQQYNGSTWANLGKLQMDVDTVDGHDAAITPQANTIAVRNASGKLEGDITGNAATADSAATLSETLGVELGGTGGTTSAAARTNLGVPPTSHASSSTTYGLGSNLNYGHVRGDGETTDVVAGEIVVKDVLFNNLISLTDSGALGRAKYISVSQSFNIDTGDFDLILINASSENSSGTYPPFLGFVYIRQYYYSRTSTTVIGNRMQVAFAYNANGMWRRYYIDGSWSDWVKIVDETDKASTGRFGIMRYGVGLGSDSSGSTIVTDVAILGNIDDRASLRGLLGNLKELSSSIPENDLNKLFKTGIWYVGAAALNNPTSAYGIVCCYHYGAYTFQMFMANDSVHTYIRKAFNNSFTPWVIQKTSIVDIVPVGDLRVSLATSMGGHLLCYGAAVSRTTYANLFAILGTTFGEGDGSTTFNLPDFRNKTLRGANGNLMSILAAGLPNITGGLSIGALTGGASGAITARSSSVLRSTTDASDSSGFTFDASRSSSIYGKSTTVQPPAIAVNFFIKY